MHELILLFLAGLGGGVLNAVAGGGTFITFPAMVAIGVPEVMANASTTVAALPGYLAAAVGFRRDVLTIERPQLLRLTFWMMVGGAVGAGLLLVSSNAAFRILVPFLLLAATLIFLNGPKLRERAAGLRSAVVPFGLATLLPVAVYGGYFNGGLGIILLALFAMWGMTDLHQMNGLKSWLSFALATIASVVFIAGGQIAWGPTLAMSVGTITGGYLGAPVSRLIPLIWLRRLIAVVGFGMTAVFFWRLFQGA